MRMTEFTLSEKQIQPIISSFEQDYLKQKKKNNMHFASDIQL